MRDYTGFLDGMLQEVRQARKSYDALMAKMAALVDECQVWCNFILNILPSQMQ